MIMGESTADVIAPGTLLVKKDHQNFVSVAIALDRLYWFQLALEERRLAFGNIDPGCREEKLNVLKDIAFDENLILVYIPGLKHKSALFPFSYYYISVKDINVDIVRSEDVMSIRIWMLAACPNGDSDDKRRMRENIIEAARELGVFQKYLAGEFPKKKQEQILYQFFARGI